MKFEAQCVCGKKFRSVTTLTLHVKNCKAWQKVPDAKRDEVREAVQGFIHATGGKQNAV